MSMARIDNGEVVATRLPRTGRLSDGRTVSGYDKLPPDVLYDEGWRDVTDDGPPEHDPETHYARRTGYVYDPDTDTVTATYKVVERPPDPEAGEHLDPQIGAPDA